MRTLVFVLAFTSSRAFANECRRLLWIGHGGVTFAQYQATLETTKRTTEFMVELLRVFDTFGDAETREVPREVVYREITGRSAFSEPRIYGYLNQFCRRGWVILRRKGATGRYVQPDPNLIARLERLRTGN